MKPKRLILSRKGFDSGENSGNGPSPIFEDGTMFSLPIPSDSPTGITYGALRHGRQNIGKVVAELTNGDYGPDHVAHFDPDVNRKAYPHRDRDWRPVFGQRDKAQGHLRNQGVGVGDVFLFFGLYQRVEPQKRPMRFDDREPWLHVMWGWFQIGGIHRVDDLGKNDFPWARYHDHFRWSDDPSNTLYMASDKLDLGYGSIAPGAGVFPEFDSSLLLTDPQGASVTKWRLPKWFDPGNDKTPLTYFGDCKWIPSGKHVYVQRNGPGQEFVLHLKEYPQAIRWLSGLVRDFGTS